MSRSACLICAFFICAILAAEAGAQSRWTLELGLTVPYNFPLSLSISQTGQPDIRLTAQYSSKPLEVPICWIWRISRWWGSQSWEFQAIHHKIFLVNKPTEVGEFSVSHGLNIVTINRGWEPGGYIVRFGAGIALTHPENVVRGKRLSENRGIFGMGYYISGPALIAGGGKSFSLVGSFILTAEVMTTFSFADVPVAEGSAQAYNLTLQCNIEIGSSFFQSSSR